jgi:hypothetical protein
MLRRAPKTWQGEGRAAPAAARDAGVRLAADGPGARWRRAARRGKLAGKPVVPIPYIDPSAAEKAFRHRVFAFLLREELISLERVGLLSSWSHSGFSVHNSVYVAVGDQTALEALVRYMDTATPSAGLA